MFYKQVWILICLSAPANSTECCFEKLGASWLCASQALVALFCSFHRLIKTTTSPRERSRVSLSARGAADLVDSEAKQAGSDDSEYLASSFHR